MSIRSDVLYKCLLDDLTSSGCERISHISEDVRVKDAAAFSIRNSLLKKFGSIVNDTTNGRALDIFTKVNTSCENWRPAECNDLMFTIIGEVKSNLYQFWNPEGFPLCSDVSDALRFARVGPGASIGSSGNDFYTKLFSSRITSTSRLLVETYKRYISQFPDWANAELIRSAAYGDIDIVEGNRLSFVPKNCDVSRIICIEPSLNMYYQLGFANILNSRAKQLWGYDESLQPDKNRYLTKVASIYDNFSTIDLSSASDSMSLSMLRYVLPKDMFRILEILRSPSTSISNHDSRVNLHMVSTMGNGSTFPLQTILFTSIVLAVMRVFDREIIYPRGANWGNFGVFGDDIICHRDLSRHVISTLEYLGFSVNKDKTFVEGSFKESCGYDYFKGINIRGVYIKNLSTPQNFYSAINQLNLFSTRTGILLKRTVQYLLTFVRYLPVPPWENDDSGIQTPEVLAPKVRDRNGSWLYHASVPSPRPIRINFTDFFIPRGQRKRLWNPPGLHTAFIAQTVNSHTIGVRHDVSRYKSVTRVAPSWCFSRSTRPNSLVNWQRWDTFAYQNLLG